MKLFRIIWSVLLILAGIYLLFLAYRGSGVELSVLDEDSATANRNLILMYMFTMSRVLYAGIGLLLVHAGVSYADSTANK